MLDRSVFEVSIGQDGADARSFIVRVIRAESGDAIARVELDVDALAERGKGLQHQVAGSAAPAVIRPAAEARVRQLGGELFTALLGTGDVLGAYRAACALAEQRGAPLRVVVRIDVPALAALPWEAMYDALRDDHVCLRGPLVRYVPVPAVVAPLAVRLPLRVLVVTASPRGSAPLDVARERDLLARALAPLTVQSLVTADVVEEATWASLQEALLGGVWHVVHFIGHGTFDAARGEGALALLDGQGGADLVEARRLVSLLRTARPMPRLVVLNACLGAAASATNLFAGTASALVRGGVCAVTAMQYAISDGAAIEFTRGFYSAVAHGRGVDDAVLGGRIAILGTGRRALEWLTPVLYLRGDDAHLFTMPAVPDEPPIRQPPPEPTDEPKDVVTAINRGRELLMAHRPSEAETAFREAVVRDPLRPLAFYGLGRALRELRRPAEAESAFRQAIGLDPTLAAAHHGLGRALHDQGRVSEAETALRAALQLDPTSAATLQALGDVLADQGREYDARRCYGSAQQLGRGRPPRS